MTCSLAIAPLRRIRFAGAAAAVAAVAAFGTLPAHAELSASSAVSNSASTSVGSLSTSLEGSSNSSSKGDRTAAGPYRVVEIAEAPADPTRVRLRLAALPQPAQPARDDNEFYLTLPRVAAEQARLATGDVVAAHRRPYGIEFARQDDGRSFFLAMADEWLRELRTQVVTL